MQSSREEHKQFWDTRHVIPSKICFTPSLNVYFCFFPDSRSFVFSNWRCLINSLNFGTAFLKTVCLMRIPRLRPSFKNDLGKKPIQTIFAYENTQADQNAYDPDFASFKFSVRSCVRSQTLMKRPFQIKMQCKLWLVGFMKRLRKTKQLHDLVFGSFKYWKDSVDQKQLMTHTLPRFFFLFCPFRTLSWAVE